MELEICIHCVAYQRRLCWMLSSILQQKGELPNIIVNLSYAKGEGNPQTIDVIDFFTKKGLKIIPLELTEEQAKNRAVARNIQTKNTNADWMLFADCDHVYDTYFFEDIYRQLLTNEFKDETRVIGSDRYSLDIPFCIDYFEKDKNVYPCEIEDVAKIVSTWPVMYVSGKRIAAGNFQLAKVDAIKKQGGIYSGRERDGGRCFKSDINFRKRMGGRVGMDVKPQYHLNHSRDLANVKR